MDRSNPMPRNNTFPNGLSSSGHMLGQYPTLLQYNQRFHNSPSIPFRSTAVPQYVQSSPQAFIAPDAHRTLFSGGLDVIPGTYSSRRSADALKKRVDICNSNFTKHRRTKGEKRQHISLRNNRGSISGSSEPSLKSSSNNQALTLESLGPDSTLQSEDMPTLKRHNSSTSLKISPLYANMQKPAASISFNNPSAPFYSINSGNPWFIQQRRGTVNRDSETKFMMPLARSNSLGINRQFNFKNSSRSAPNLQESQSLAMDSDDGFETEEEIIEIIGHSEATTNDEEQSEATKLKQSFHQHMKVLANQAKAMKSDAPRLTKRSSLSVNHRLQKHSDKSLPSRPVVTTRAPVVSKKSESTCPDKKLTQSEGVHTRRTYTSRMPSPKVQSLSKSSVQKMVSSSTSKCSYDAPPGLRKANPKKFQGDKAAVGECDEEEEAGGDDEEDDMGGDVTSGPTPPSSSLGDGMSSYHSDDSDHEDDMADIDYDCISNLGEDDDAVLLSLEEEDQLFNVDTNFRKESTGENEEDFDLFGVDELTNSTASLKCSSPRRDHITKVKKDPPNEEESLSPFIRSLFPNVPPVLRFVKEGLKITPLKSELRKYLKWRIASITPVVVKRAIARSGFTVSKKSYDWLGYFGHHMKPPGFRSIREYQKVNHIPGSFQIGRKDRLWLSLSRMSNAFGRSEFNFFPRTYCLPSDLRRLKRVWEESGKQKWIIKPPASARGIGVRVIHKWQQVPKRRAVIVQKYIHKPYLINGSKFDLRLYVYVSSFDPLRVYMYEDGLVRFASQQYSNSYRNLGNRFMHLTNYSVNKKNANFKVDSAPPNMEGSNPIDSHKWRLNSLWIYLKDRGVDTDALWGKIKDLVLKTVISCDGNANSMVKMFCRRRACAHELFGFDVLLDEKLRPWILEVNISPSLHSNSPLDIEVKSGMVSDMLSLAGFQIPDPADLVPLNQLPPAGTPLPPNYQPPFPECSDKRLWDPQLTPDQRAKHAYYCQRVNEDTSILETLTPDDLRILIESLDEFQRAGRYIRLFPLSGSQGLHYMKFLYQPRYYNLLLHAYLTKYQRNEVKGEALLYSLCAKKIHLQSPATSSSHTWSPPLAVNIASSPLNSSRNNNSIGRRSVDKLAEKGSFRGLSSSPLMTRSSPFKSVLSNSPKVVKDGNQNNVKTSLLTSLGNNSWYNMDSKLLQETPLESTSSDHNSPPISVPIS